MEKQGRKEIGLYLVRSPISPALYTGDTGAIFNLSGNTPVSMDKLNTYFRGLDNSLKHFLTTLKLISSYPGLLLSLREKKASLNSFIETYLCCIVAEV